MSNYFDFISAVMHWKVSVLVRSIIAFVFCCTYVLIKMALFGEECDVSTIESIILLIGSIALSNLIVNKISNHKDKDR